VFYGETCGVNFQLDHWRYIEIQLDTWASGEIQLFVDGELVFDMADVETRPTDGSTYAVVTKEFDFYAYQEYAHFYDDLYVVDSSDNPSQPLGPAVVQVFLPITDTDTNEWTPSGPGDHYTHVDDAFPEGTVAAGGVDTYLATETVGRRSISPTRKSTLGPCTDWL